MSDLLAIDNGQFALLSRHPFQLTIMDSIGQIVWVRRISVSTGGVLDIMSSRIDLTPSGEFIIAVEHQGNIRVLKIDVSGNILWDNSLGGSGVENAANFCILSNGDIVVTGWTQSFTALGEDIYIIKLNSSGNLVWTRYFGSPGHDIGLAIAEAPNGDLILTGSLDSDSYYARLTANGLFVWEKTVHIGLTGHDIILGDSLDIATILAKQGNRLALIKMDSSGNFLVIKNFNNLRVDGLPNLNLSKTLDGGYAVSGMAHNSNLAHLDIKLDENFNIQWVRIGSDDSRGVAMIQTSIGKYVSVSNPNLNIGGWANAEITLMNEIGVSCCNNSFSTSSQNISVAESPVYNNIYLGGILTTNTTVFQSPYTFQYLCNFP